MKVFVRVAASVFLVGLFVFAAMIFTLSSATELNPFERLEYAASAVFKLNDQYCMLSLQQTDLKFTPAPIQSSNPKCDQPFAVRAGAYGDIAVPGTPVVSCRVARALIDYADAVQPIAQAHLGQGIVGLEHKGTYNCRSVRNRPGVMSQHATANAIDISGFKLADGSVVRLAEHWNGQDARSQFLRAAHEMGCGVFNLGLGPDYDALHQEHFHYDMGLWRGCK